MPPPSSSPAAIALTAERTPEATAAISSTAAIASSETTTGWPVRRLPEPAKLR